MICPGESGQWFKPLSAAIAVTETLRDGPARGKGYRWKGFFSAWESYLEGGPGDVELPRFSGRFISCDSVGCKGDIAGGLLEVYRKNRIPSGSITWTKTPERRRSITRAEKAWVAFAAPAFLADPVLVDPNAQGINQFQVFEEIPGTFDLRGVRCRAWRSASAWNDLLLGVPLVVRHRQPPEEG